TATSLAIRFSRSAALAPFARTAAHICGLEGVSRLWRLSDVWATDSWLTSAAAANAATVKYPRFLMKSSGLYLPHQQPPPLLHASSLRKSQERLAGGSDTECD